MKNNFLTPIKYTLYSIGMLFAIYCSASLLWIVLTDYRLPEFCIVLSLILKNAAGYSVLLVGVVITICFQIYTKEQEIAKEDHIKIKEVGYYTLGFKRDEDSYTEVYRGEKQVVIISDDKDYFEEENEDKIAFMVKFLSSKKENTNLKNVMAFDDLYFQKNKKKILSDYYSYCEKVHYATPLYCATKPTSEIKNKDEADRTRYFWMLIDNNEFNPAERKEKVFWVSAVTQEGILLFIKVKAGFQEVEKGLFITLLQQTTYYKSTDKICPLYR